MRMNEVKEEMAAYLVSKIPSLNDDPLTVSEITGFVSYLVSSYAVEALADRDTMWRIAIKR